MNLFPHATQLYGFCPEWDFMWRVRLDWALNFILHTVQPYGFSPVCVIVCLTRSSFSLKLLPQSAQMWGFSPVWIRMWAFMFPTCVNPVRLLSRVWVHVRLQIVALDETFATDTAVVRFLSCVCVFMWRVRMDLILKFLLQTLHVCGLLTVSPPCCGCLVTERRPPLSLHSLKSDAQVRSICNFRIGGG